MPPPETKSISFSKPSLLKWNSKSSIVDLDKAMIPTPLRTLLQDISGDDLVGMVLLPQFGYLYVAMNNQLLDYELNLLDNQNKPFQIQKIGDNAIQIAPKGLANTPVLFDFGTDHSDDDSLRQAKQVAKEMESLLGYKIQET